MRARLARWVLPLALTVWGAPFAAWAQGSATEIDRQKQAALALAEQGDRFLQAGKWEKAIEAFVAADRTFHAPTFLLALAEARTKAGRLLAARGTYEAVVAEKLAPYAPRAFFEAQDKARSALRDLETRIPRLTLEKGPWPSGAVVTLGGKALAERDAGVEVAFDPGTIELEARAPGKVTIRRSIALVSGARERVRLEWTDEPRGIPTPPVASSSPPAEAPRVAVPPPTVATPAESTTPVPAYVAFGLAGAAAVVGTVLAVRTVGLRDDFDAEPTQEGYDEAQMSALLTDIAFGSALALGLGGGAYLWLQSGNDAINPTAAGWPRGAGVQAIVPF